MKDPKLTSVAAAIMAAPASAAGQGNVVDLAAARAAATPKQDDFDITQAEQPADRPELAYGRAQVAALVIVQGQSVASIPPQVFASVVFKDSPDEIVALVGPEKDLASVRDAMLFASAFKLRDALQELVARIGDHLDPEDGPPQDSPEWRDLIAARVAAKQVLDESSPKFLAVTPKKTAEQKLAEATANFDPSLTPDTSGILGTTASTIEVEQGQVIQNTDSSPEAAALIGGHDGPGGFVAGVFGVAGDDHVNPAIAGDGSGDFGGAGATGDFSGTDPL